MPYNSQGFTVVLSGRRTEIQMPDQLAMSNKHDLKELVRDEIRDGCRHLILDCSNLKYLDSYGWGMFVTLRRMLDEVRGTLETRHWNEDHLDMIYDILKFQDVLGLPSRENLSCAS